MASIEEITGRSGNRATIQQIAEAAPMSDKMAVLEEFRKAVDEGEISWASYEEAISPLVKRVSEDVRFLGTQGSDAATYANELKDQLVGLGWSLDSVSFAPEINASAFSESVEKDIRERYLPTNIPEDLRQQLVDLPTNIRFGSDRFEIERQAVREGLVAKEEENVTKTERKQYLGELGDILTKRSKEILTEDIPGVKEEMQGGGLLDTSAYGEALARHQASLGKQTLSSLAEYGVRSGESDIERRQELADRVMGYQASGLERQFSLQDIEQSWAKQADLARLMQPQSQGKTSGEKWMQGIQLALGSATTGKYLST